MPVPDIPFSIELKPPNILIYLSSGYYKLAGSEGNVVMGIIAQINVDTTDYVVDDFVAIPIQYVYYLVVNNVDRNWVVIDETKILYKETP